MTACVFILFILPANAASVVPEQAYAVGYKRLTFSTTFNETEVSIGAGNMGGFHWYLWNLFGEEASIVELRFNEDHSLTLLGGRSGPNAQLATVGRIKGKPGFVGEAFGGGAYVEANLKFDPEDVERERYVGHPSFWSMAIEHLLDESSGGAGQVRFEHFIEADFFEYDLLRYLKVTNVYGGALREWYGIWKTTCAEGLCSVTSPSIEKWVPPSTNFRAYHTYGFLWVPATEKRNGYAQYYFDNRPIGQRIEWSLSKGVDSTKVSSLSDFSIIDRQHLVLILGTGVNEPMTVRWVHVFQSSTHANMYSSLETSPNGYRAKVFQERKENSDPIER